MFQNLKLRYYRAKAIRTLIRRYEYENEVNKLMEDYDTAKLLNGGSEKFVAAGRAQLAEMQAKVRETDLLINFLKGL
jgi:hypothetical protein